MKFYLVTAAQCDDQGEAMNKVGCQNRLLSYYYLQKGRPGLLEDYAKRGYGRYIDEEYNKIKKMNAKDFFEYLNEMYEKGDRI